MKTTKKEGEKKGLSLNELTYLCGFIQMRIDNEYQTGKEERKKLKIILKKLRELKK